MSCKKFENWLSSGDDATGDPIPHEVDKHMSTCRECSEIYTVDQHLEKHIRQGLQTEQLPAGLYKKIDAVIDDSTPGLNFGNRLYKLVAGVGAAAILIIAIYFNFLHTPSHFKDLHQLTQHAVERHLKGDTTMAFGALNIENGLVMLSKELKFNVLLPNLANKEYILLGGRLCVVGNCKTAYLFYQYQQKTCSLFIMDYDNFDFQMADGSRFNNVVKGCRTDIWKENGQVYTMVY